MKKKDYESVEAEISSVLAELVLDENTTEHIRVQILNKLLQDKTNQSFFDTILEEDLDVGECPYCGHQNHWLVPEEDLNQRGIVTYEEDPRVKKNTTAQDCGEFQEACAKKKVSA